MPWPLGRGPLHWTRTLRQISGHTRDDKSQLELMVFSRATFSESGAQGDLWVMVRSRISGVLRFLADGNM